MAADDATVFAIVLALRLLVPLAILRFPLPAILAALVIDAADQTIFQTMTNIDLEEFNYQGYDKALDVHYLAIAYIATFRNWKSGVAIAVAAALWYYRLVGVTLFELTEWRPLLILFPNTFEYFFILFAIVRLRYDTDRLSTRQIVGAAAAIWVFIKLPQEYWIHIAQLDVTDFVKEDLLGVDPSEGWGAAFGNRPGVAVLLVAAGIALVAGLGWGWRRLPPGDHPITFDADALPGARSHDPFPPRRWQDGLGEKIVLLTLIMIIFAQAIEGTTATTGEIVFGVAVLVTANAGLTQLVRGRETSWRTVVRAFVTTLAVNATALLALTVLLPNEEDEPFWSTAFFLLLLSLIISLYDRYRPPRPYGDAAPVVAAVPVVAARGLDVLARIEPEEERPTGGS